MEKRSAPQHNIGRPATVARDWRGGLTLQRAAGHAATFTLAALLVAAPLHYGAVLPTGHMIVQTLAFIAATLAILAARQGRSMGAAWIAIAALIGVALLGAWQLLPMSADALQRLAPVSAEAYRAANETLRLFGRPAVTARISLAPAMTVATTLLTLAYLAAFVAATIVSRDRRARKILIATLLAASAIHIIAVAAAGDVVSRISGSFVNPNNFAGYLLIALCFAFGVIWREVLYGPERAAGATDLGARVERRAVPLILCILLWAVIATGIGLTRSRGGILAAIVATAVLSVLAPLHQRVKASRRRLIALGSLALIAGVGFVGVVAGEAPLLRFLGSDPRDIESDVRLKMWRASVEAWERSPTVGTGLGTFREAFRRVQPQDVRGLVEHAHNDFLQMLVTGGWIGAALAVIAYGSMIVLLIHAWAPQTHREESAIALAAIGALIALAVHGLVEFNLSIPAIPVTLAVMTGVGWAAARAE